MVISDEFFHEKISEKFQKRVFYKYPWKIMIRFVFFRFVNFHPSQTYKLNFHSLVHFWPSTDDVHIVYTTNTTITALHQQLLETVLIDEIQIDINIKRMTIESAPCTESDCILFFKQKVDCDCQCVGRTITFVKTSQQLVCGQMVEYLTTIASNLCWKNVKFQLRLPGLVFY